MLQRGWVIYWKEIVDNLRDRRSVINALIAVLINPLIYILLFGFLSRTFSEQIERPLQLPVVGGEYAPSLIEFLDQRNVDILEPPADPETAVRSGDVDVVLVIPEEFGEKFTEALPATVQLLVDDSNQGAGIAADRARSLVQQYSGQTGTLRLLARGVSPQILSAVPVETVNVARQSEEVSGVVLNLLPVVMLTAVFFGGFYLAVDTTAGERERKSLEPLLLNPLPRWVFVLGKFAAILTFTMVATFLATALFLVLLGIPQVQSFTNIRVNLGFDVILADVAIMIPVAIMAVGLEMLVASYARTVKEASTYTQFVALAGFMPALFLSVLPIGQVTWLTLVPTVAQLYFINDLSRGEPLDMGLVVVASLIAVAIGVIALIATVRLFNQERIILGKPTA